MGSASSRLQTPVPKLVFVNRYFFPDESATSRMLSDLAFRLARCGVAVAVVTSRQLYSDAQADLPAREFVNGVDVHRVATASRGRSRLAGRAMDYASFHVMAGRTLLRMLARGDVVVAKTDPPLISATVARAAAWKDALLVNWLQDLFPEVASVLTPGLVPSWLERLLLALRDNSLRTARMNVVLSDGMRRHVLARIADERRVRTIPNWADVANIVPLPTDASVTRHRLGLSRRFVVGYSGNFGRAHEFETLLGAACLLREESRFAFLMTGAGAKSGGLRQAVQGQGLNNFVFQDYQPPELLSDSMAAADVHLVSLLPALEGLIVPSKVYGILAAARPAVFIGDPAGDLATMLHDRVCGVSVRVGDSADLAAQLRALADDANRLDALGRNARQLALQRYTSEHAVSDWIEFLTQVAPKVAGGGVQPVQTEPTEAVRQSLPVG